MKKRVLKSLIVQAGITAVIMLLANDVSWYKAVACAFIIDLVVDIIIKHHAKS